MAAREGWIDGPLHVVSWTILMPVLVLAGLTGECAGSDPGMSFLATQAPGWTHPRLVYLQPGLRITNKPPEGWSHLVLKSMPRISSGDRGTLPSGASKTAALFRTAIVANVRPVDAEERDFELTQIGVGICVPRDEDHDIVVTADRLDALGLHFSTVQRVVLDAAEAELAEGRIIARTSTFALLRSPATILVAGNKHRKVDLNYAFCVERATGHLKVAVWTMRPESETQQAPAVMVKLGGNPVYDCEIDVRAKRILGTVPYSWSFAMRSLPPGRTLRVPPALGELIAATNRRPADKDPEELGRMLLNTMSPPPDATQAVHRTAIPPPYRSSQ
jgi:hypothetical protein